MKYSPELVEAMARGIDPGSWERLGRNPNSSGYEAGVIASLRKARAALDALVATLPAVGCKIVQREPTEEMIEAGLQASPTFRVVLDSGRREHRSVDTAEIENINRAMFDAAPDVPEAWQEKPQ